jgi:hypothetical protein
MVRNLVEMAVKMLAVKFDTLRELENPLTAFGLRPEGSEAM